MSVALPDLMNSTSAALVSRLSTVADGLAYQGANCVCSAGMLSAGTAVNVVPTTAEVSGTVRTFTGEQRVEVFARLDALCAAIGDAHGVEVHLEVPESTPAGVKARPVGRVPEVRLNVGAGAPDAVYVKL